MKDKTKEQLILEEKELRRKVTELKRLENEHRRKEEELQKAHHDLEVKVRERTAERAQANEKLRAEISERKSAEYSLHEERRLFIGGPTVVFKWKAAEGWPVEYVSPNVVNQFGYQPDEFTSGKVLYAAIIYPDDLNRVAEEVKRHTEENTPCFEQSYRIARADGSYRWVDDFTVVIRDPSGKVTHYHGYLLDVTKRKQVEEELKKHHEHLEEQVRKRTTELKRMIDAMALRVVRVSDLEMKVAELRKQIIAAGMIPVVGEPLPREDE